MSRFRFAVVGACLLISAAVVVPAAAASAAPAAQFTGTRLVSALLPTSAFGAGMTVLKGSPFNSGPRLEHGARYSLATVSCENLYTVPMGFGETAAAGNEIGNGTYGFTQEVYQFASPARAASFFHGSYGAYGRCNPSSWSMSGFTARPTRWSIAAGHAGRYQAFFVDQTAAITGQGVKPFTNRWHFVFVLAGSYVYLMIPSTFSAVPPQSARGIPLVLALIARTQAL